MELLAPAGSVEKMKAAFAFGADAVYLSGKRFGLRAQSDNFHEEEMEYSVRYAHDLGKKVYVTINIYARNEDLEEVEKHIRFLKTIQPDGLIISDPGVLRMVKQYLPEVEIHLSTQTNLTNYEAVKFWQDMGVKRFILARELSSDEIRQIKRETGADLEIFVHGAMCMAYSGRCLLSDFLASRGANNGNCAQPCRWSYSLVEERRPGEYFPIEEDERGTYIFNSKDLNLASFLPEIREIGVDSIKIEGRNKGIYYAAGVTRAYRAALDILADISPRVGEYNLEIIHKEYESFLEPIQRELSYISHRHYTDGFFPGRENGGTEVPMQNYGDNSYIRGSDFLGIILSVNPTARTAKVDIRGKFVPGEEIQVMTRKIQDDFFIRPETILDDAGTPQEFTRPNTMVDISLDSPIGLEPGFLLRRIGK